MKTPTKHAKHTTTTRNGHKAKKLAPQSPQERLLSRPRCPDTRKKRPAASVAPQFFSVEELAAAKACAEYIGITLEGYIRQAAFARIENDFDDMRIDVERFGGEAGRIIQKQYQGAKPIMKRLGYEEGGRFWLLLGKKKVKPLRAA